MAEKDNIHSLQIYRGLAALAVLLYHATVLVDERYNHAPLGGFFSAGFMGVHVFFVLSGFIMLFVHADDFSRPARIGPFLRKRFTRIYPVYWAVLLPSALFYFLYLERPLEIHHFIGNLVLVKASGFSAIVPVAWTLFHEILFYGMFATLILNLRLGIILFSAWITLMILVGYMGMDLAPPYLLTTLTGIDYGAIRAFFTLATSSLNSLFLFGLAAFGLYRLLKRNPARDAIGLLSFIAGILLILALGAEYNANHPVRDYSWAHLHHLTLGFGLAALLLMTSAASDTLESFFSRRSALQFLGKASYSIYLIHLPIQKLFVFLVQSFMPNAGEFVAHFIFFSAAILSIGGGGLLYLTVEKPLLRYCKAIFTTGVARRD
jgi:peptidoglycan/LPS O-acetylase OafA/YrhL